MRNLSVYLIILPRIVGMFAVVARAQKAPPQAEWDKATADITGTNTQLQTAAVEKITGWIKTLHPHIIARSFTKNKFPVTKLGDTPYFLTRASPMRMR